MLPDFGIGTIFDCFHVTGKHPVEIDRLNSLVTGTAMLAGELQHPTSATCFRNILIVEDT